MQKQNINDGNVLDYLPYHNQSYIQAVGSAYKILIKLVLSVIKLRKILFAQ